MRVLGLLWFITTAREVPERFHDGPGATLESSSEKYFRPFFFIFARAKYGKNDVH